MCAEAFLTLLRERVRQQQEQQRLDDRFGPPGQPRFVPWTLPPSPASAEATTPPLRMAAE